MSHVPRPFYGLYLLFCTRMHALAVCPFQYLLSSVCSKHVPQVCCVPICFYQLRNQCPGTLHVPTCTCFVLICASAVHQMYLVIYHSTYPQCTCSVPMCTSCGFRMTAWFLTTFLLACLMCKPFT